MKKVLGILALVGLLVLVLLWPGPWRGARTPRRPPPPRLSRAVSP